MWNPTSVEVMRTQPRGRGVSQSALLAGAQTASRGACCSGSGLHQKPRPCTRPKSSALGSTTVFYENLRGLVRMSLATQNTIRLPWGSDSTVVPLVSAVDVARVAAGLLTAAEVPSGSTYPLIGALLSVRDIVAAFGRVLGGEIRYEEISDEQWRADALARGFNQHALEHLSQLWRSLRAAAVTPDNAAFQVTETIERLGGAPPTSFEDFVREERAVLLGEPTLTLA